MTKPPPEEMNRLYNILYEGQPITRLQLLILANYGTGEHLLRTVAMRAATMIPPEIIPSCTHQMIKMNTLEELKKLQEVMKRFGSVYPRKYVIEGAIKEIETLRHALTEILQPFGRINVVEGVTACSVCNWAALKGSPRQHTDNCPIPIAEAALGISEIKPESQPGV